MSNGNAAVIGVLAFLAAGGGGLVALAVVAWALGTGRRRLGLTVVKLAGAGAALYGLVLLVVSLSSQRRVLVPGEEKYFCEIDCHLAYSVLAAARTQVLGTGPSSRTANGLFYVVTLRTRFDETTIGPHRGVGSLTPNPLAVALYDGEGRKYLPIDVPADVAGESVPLTQSLVPGQSYLTKLVFDLPPNAGPPALLLTEDLSLALLIIGHENSLLHQKTWLGLPG